MQRVPLHGGVPPQVIVVLASAAEASGAGLETIKAIAELKDGPPPKKTWGFKGMVGGGENPVITHAGPLLITAVVTPFDFEGPRWGCTSRIQLESHSLEAPGFNPWNPCKV
jgi:hypothetical protein